MQAKASEGRLRVLDTLAMDSHKTVSISKCTRWCEQSVLEEFITQDSLIPSCIRICK